MSPHRCEFLDWRNERCRDQAIKTVPMADGSVAWWCGSNHQPPVIAKSTKVPRNAPCGCGSGRKAKKCCL